MILLSEQPTIDINKIVHKYQGIVSDLQLQNILLSLRVDELQQQMSAQLAAQALGQETVKPKEPASKKDWKNKDWDTVPANHS